MWCPWTLRFHKRWSGRPRPTAPPAEIGTVVPIRSGRRRRFLSRCHVVAETVFVKSCCQGRRSFLTQGRYKICLKPRDEKTRRPAAPPVTAGCVGPCDRAKRKLLNSSNSKFPDFGAAVLVQRPKPPDQRPEVANSKGLPVRFPRRTRFAAVCVTGQI